MAAKRDLVGKIIEIESPSGFIYGLCTHDLKEMGQVLKLYQPLFENRIDCSKFEFETVEFRTSVRFPLRYVLKEPDINIVGCKKLTADECQLPIFRQAGNSGVDQPSDGWWIVDGDDETWVDALSREMATYPDDGFFSLDIIFSWYEKDIYPWSESQLAQGPLDFDPSKIH